ncbi:MAG: T9SS type A sorting domain-containing protein, partial [Bacteroidota bacterium]
MLEQFACPELISRLELDEIHSLLQIYNVNGQLVRQATVSGTQTQVAIEDLQEGMYLVQFQSGDKLW